MNGTMAALTQQDERLQFDLFCKEVREKRKKRPGARLGMQKRGTDGAVTAILLLAGADILVMRHPEAIVGLFGR
jgi:acetyl-CoA decarbonylase/synthase complex subunit delta